MDKKVILTHAAKFAFTAAACFAGVYAYNCYQNWQVRSKATAPLAVKPE